MGVINLFITMYFIIGFILAFLWWNDTFQEKYDDDAPRDILKEILILLESFFFWPFKLIRDFFSNLMR